MEAYFFFVIFLKWNNLIKNNSDSWVATLDPTPFKPWFFMLPYMIAPNFLSIDFICTIQSLIEETNLQVLNL